MVSWVSLAFRPTNRTPVFQLEPVPVTVARLVRPAACSRLALALVTEPPFSTVRVPAVAPDEPSMAKRSEPETDQAEPAPVTRTSPLPPLPPTTASPVVVSVPPFCSVSRPLPPVTEPIPIAPDCAPAAPSTVGLGVMVLMVVTVVAPGTALLDQLPAVNQSVEAEPDQLALAGATLLGVSLRRTSLPSPAV